MCIVCMMKNPFAFDSLPQSDRAKARARRIKVELDYLEGKISTMGADDPERSHYEDLRSNLKEEQYSLNQEL